jgi:hypothetical protein
MLTSSSNPGGASKSTSKNLGEFELNVHELEDVSITMKQLGASTNLLERDSDAKGDSMCFSTWATHENQETAVRVCRLCTVSNCPRVALSVTVT